ncbi:hypothetical protein [Nocardiopsis aegyptia]|uniref:Uncharacterized protein n=1 Tax=Nocardiopsis aegyptia TaxID=220378 RepID=A0A7Z0JCT3_9ACTN|nr:hypothetical protein [Nocardiopsis aegyptia]NYJ37788.1 hypothetical protein [Nocardiopsis aegyptia]
MITTSFPFDSNRDRLERSAREHARALALERGLFDDGPIPLDGPVVDDPRHAGTDDGHDPSAARHRAAEEAIAVPSPAAKRGRHGSGRAHDDNAAWENAVRDDAAQTASAEGNRNQEDGRERGPVLGVESREAIRELWVGQRVSFPYKRRRYTGVVTKLGRTRVVVAYRIATGRDRDRVRLVHASLVTPVEVEDR